MTINLTDWRGNTYGPGSRVIYAAMSGRSVELQEATVLEINRVYRDSDTYKWRALKEGESVPKKKIWDSESRQYKDSDEEVDTELRVKLQPEGKGSRNFSIRQDAEYDWVNSITGEEGDFNLMDKLYYTPARIEAKHRTGYIYDVDYKAIAEKMEKAGWKQRVTAVKPRPVTLTVINNITVI